MDQVHSWKRVVMMVLKVVRNGGNIQRYIEAFGPPQRGTKGYRKKMLAAIAAVPDEGDVPIPFGMDEWPAESDVPLPFSFLRL